MRCWGVALVGLVIAASSGTARAEPTAMSLGGAPDLGSLVDRGLRIYPESRHFKLNLSGNEDRPPASDDVARARAHHVMLHPSLVARDWGSALGVLGDAIPTDFIRLTRSSRMGLFRLTLGETFIRPYVHAALGEWRYDRDLLPYMPRNQEYASQFAGGFAVHIGGLVFAAEADYTVLLRERREPQNLPTPHVLGAFAVLDSRF